MNNTIIFDGDCIFCNRFISYVVAHDKGVFRLLDRNGESFKTIKQQFGINETYGETIYVLKGERFLEKSSAIRYILLHCGWKGKVAAGLMYLCPTGIRNRVYDFISRNRKKINTTSCRRPDAGFLSRMVP
jgi:predicted DCC family thiol-disulfide oxidoreductase YuxK